MKFGKTWLAAWVVIAVTVLFCAPAKAQETGAASDTVATQQAPVENEKAGALSAVDTTGKNIAKGIGEASYEMTEAAKTGGANVVGQGRKLWQEAVLPMFQRIAAALPSLVKALVLLLGFWIAARVLGAVVTKALAFTKLDEKAAHDWGLGGLLKGQDGKAGSLEKFAGSVVKWVILLIGFVAFFNALNLPMVADPLQNIVHRISDAIPSLLKAFVILFAYWVVASLARLGATKVLNAANFDKRAERFIPPREEKGQKVGPTALAGRLIFYLVLLFGLTPFLQALGQESLVAPLQEMLGKALGFIPNIFVAALILFTGNIAAVVVREVTSSFLAAVGADGAADRLQIGAMFGGKKLSSLVGSIVYFFILISVIMLALDKLHMTAISEPVRNTLAKVLDAVPAILVATIIVFIGFAIARVVRGLIESLLSGIGFDTLPSRAGLDFLIPKAGGSALSSVVATIVMIVILLLTAQQALAFLHFDQIAGLLNRLVNYLPDLAVGIIILLASMSLGRYVGGLVEKATYASPYSTSVATIARYAITILGIGMALDEMHVSERIVTSAVTAMMGGAALALGLAFGLGGKDKAKEIIERHNTY